MSMIISYGLRKFYLQHKDKVTTFTFSIFLIITLVLSFFIKQTLINNKGITKSEAASLNQYTIFDDALRTGFTTNQFGTNCYRGAYTAQKATGTASMGLDLNHFCTTILYLSNYSSGNRIYYAGDGQYTDLEFDIYGLSPVATCSPDTQFDLSLNNVHYTSTGSALKICNYVTTIDQTWRHVKIPIDDFGALDGTEIIGLGFRNDNNVTGNGLILIDNLSFTKYPDTTPPTLIQDINIDLSHISLTFSEKVNSVDAENKNNYLISSVTDINFASGVIPSSVSLSPGGTVASITLPKTMQNNVSYKLSVSNIHDLAVTPNLIAANSFINFTAILQTATLTVNAGTNIHAFKNEMRGAGMATWMHMAATKADHDAGNGKPYPGEIPRLIELSKQAKIGVVRFAGGNWANATAWDRTNNATTPNERYTAEMIDSLADFKIQTGAEVMIQTNICSNNPSMWADMVKYTNVEHNYNFKYWEVGSENNYDTCAGLDESTFPARFISYRDAMKAIDPTIKVVGPASAGFTGNPENPNPSNPTGTGEWFMPLIKATHNTGKDLDGLIWHWYQSNEGYTGDICTTNDYGPTVGVIFNYDTYIVNDPVGCHGTAGDVIPDADWLMGHRRKFGEVANNWFKSIYLTNSPNTFFGISELNTLAGAGVNALEANHVAALWFADMIPRLAYSGQDFNTMYDLYDQTTYALINPSNDLTPNPSNTSISPTYYTMFMLGKYFGNQLVQSATSDPKQQITVWASKDTNDPNKLKLMVTNMSQYSVSANLNISGFNPTSGVYYELSNPNPLDTKGSSALNSGGSTLNGSQINTSTVQTIQSSVNAIQPINLSGVSNSLNHAFPPYTATSIILSNSSVASPTPTNPITPTSTSSVSNKDKGDFNGDNKVDLTDLSILASNWLQNTSLADANGDGKVDITDLSILAQNWMKIFTI